MRIRPWRKSEPLSRNANRLPKISRPLAKRPKRMQRSKTKKIPQLSILFWRNSEKERTLAEHGEHELHQAHHQAHQHPTIPASQRLYIATAADS